MHRVHLSARRLGWGAQKRSHRQQQLFQDGRALPPGSAGRGRRLAGDGKGLACPLRGDAVADRFGETFRTAGDYYAAHASAVKIEDVSPWLSELAEELIAEPDADAND